MEYIHYFETKAQFREAYSGGEYKEPWTSYIEEGGGEITYNKPDYTKIPFTIEALGTGNITWGLNDKTVQYSKNGGSWETMDSGTAIPVVDGDEVQFKGMNTKYYETTISATTRFNVKGNIMSLTNGDGFETAYFVGIDGFSELFKGCAYLISAGDLKLPATTLSQWSYDGMFQYCTSLTTAPELPATTLGEACYSRMFQHCTSLTTAPELPATTLAVSCYDRMFAGCTSLTTAPELPATILNNSCYHQMFLGCTNLTTSPELPATTMKSSCYSQMFDSCTSLTAAPELPATTLNGNCYNKMFGGCTNLTTSPELPATTLASGCYEQMFNGCTNLTTAPALPATTLADSCYMSMFWGCTNLTTAPELPATTLVEWCYYEMFKGCTSLTTAPELPATTLMNRCYKDMFNGCTFINYIKCLATDISAYGCTDAWLTGVSATGTFVKSPSMTGWTTGNNGIPSGWTVVDAE